MTAADLSKQIARLIEAELRKMDAATRANYISVRRSVLAGAKSMWDVAAVTPRISTETGGMVYVDKSAAMKYGRFDKLTEEVKGITKKGLLTDISNLEYHGKRVYELQYTGDAWVYQQGYGLPITGGVKVPLVAKAVYSDFYGRSFEDTLRKNWALYADDILAGITRELNQGHSYTQMAKVIQARTDRSYADSLRVSATEAHRIQAMASVDTDALLDELEIPFRKIWVATVDNVTRDDHAQMDGEEADEDGAEGIFTLPDGARGLAPGLTGTPQNDIRCRCDYVKSIAGIKPTERRIRGEGIVPYETFTQRLERKADIPLRDLRAAK
jgi:hypothetical protein